jgi:hypothetical protein
MSEPEIVYEDRAVILRRGHDEKGWFYVEETYYPLPRFMNHVRYRISLSPSSRTCELLKVWNGWAVGEGGLTGSSFTKVRLDEEEGAELRKRLQDIKTPDEFSELWDMLYWRD